MNQDLVNYINKSRSAGQTDEQIRQSLVSSGWSQAQVDDALGVPKTPNIPAPPSPNQSATMSSFLDKKTKDTVMWSIIGYFIRSIVITIAGAAVAYILVPQVNVFGVPISYGSRFNLNLGGVIISSIIYGGLAGVILAKFYGKIQDINRRYFGGWFNTLYKLVFYPSVIGGILALLFAGGFSVSFLGGTGFGGYFLVASLVNVVATIIGSFSYAKLMVNKVGQYYN